jgi:drug/metabolite transporter (DMT)-like permease
VTGAPLLLAVLLAASLEPVLARHGYRYGVDPWQLLHLKSVVACAVMLPFSGCLARLHGAQLGGVAQAALLLLFTNTCLLLAVQRLSAATVVTLLSLTPALVALTSQRRGRDRLSPRFWPGLGCCLAGVALSVGAAHDSLTGDAWGLALVTLAVLSSAAYRTRLEELCVPPLLMSTGIFWIHGLLAGACLRPWLSPLPPAAWPIGVWLGVAAALANLGFVFAIRQVGATTMSVFNLLQRPLVVILASLTLGEPLSGPQWLGAGLVLAGVRTAQVQRTAFTGR